MAENHFSAEVVQRIGFYSFATMSSLIVICIAFGFYAVLQKFNEPSWKEACITNGGVPVQIAKSTFDCKVI